MHFSSISTPLLDRNSFTSLECGHSGAVYTTALVMFEHLPDLILSGDLLSLLTDIDYEEVPSESTI